MDSHNQSKNSNSIEDIFDSSLNLEQTHLKEGYDEGYAHGLATGKEEAKDVGLKHGFETGEELGFYKGCVDVWNSAIRIAPTRFSARLRKGIKQMEELIEKYPVNDPENESVQEIMEALRLKFRIIRAALALLFLECCLKVYLLKLLEVYISESQNKAALESIEQAARLFSAAIIVNKFEDVTYNRVGYTVVSKLAPTLSSDSCPLKSTVFAMIKAAFENIEPGMHSGSHPRLGVVDHICFHPLASAPLDQVAGIAKSVVGDIGSGLQVPTFLYGAAHEEGRTLDSIRRELGYFKPNSAGNQWAGGLKSEPFSLKPDKGPESLKRIAKQVSERGGGLASVQAMVLIRGEDITEVECNLLKPSKIGGDKVQVEVDELAAVEGMAVGKGYYTDLSQEEIIERYMKLNSSA
ncbi:hypothetical protein WN943_010854 [Citrus x changshan-huyou]